MSRTPEPSSEQLARLSTEDAAIVREAFRAFAEMETAPPVPEALQRRIDAEAGAADAQKPAGPHQPGAERHRDGS